MTQVLDLTGNTPSVLAQAADALRAGAVIGFPTETVYGIGVAFDHADALASLRELKARDEVKPFQILIADHSDVKRLGLNPSQPAKALMTRFWPGAMTLVLPHPEGHTLGLRMPDFGPLRDLLRQLGRPLVATSANFAGEPPATSAGDVAAIFGESLPLVLDGGPARMGTASSVVSIQGTSLTVLREGAITKDRLLDAWNEHR